MVANRTPRQLETGCDDQPINRAGSLGDSNHLALMEAESSRSEEPRSDQRGYRETHHSLLLEVCIYIDTRGGGGDAVGVSLWCRASLGHTYSGSDRRPPSSLFASCFLWFLKT